MLSVGGCCGGGKTSALSLNLFTAPSPTPVETLDWEAAVLPRLLECIA